MDYEGHGGSCCGYGHIFEMDHTSIEDFREGLEEHLTAAAGLNRIVEVILSERQINPRTAWDRRQIHDSVTAAGGWPAVLAAEGFRLAAEWRNSNSGNNCYQFIRIPTLLTDDAGYNRTFRWEAGIIPAVGVAPIPVPGVPVVPGVPERYRGTHPQPPAGPVDHTLPILVWDYRTSMYYPVTRVRSVDVGIEPRIYASGTGRGCTLTGDIWYHAATGRLGGSPIRGQLVNYVPDAPAAPVPAPAAPVAARRRIDVNATEFYANLRVSGRRGPFDTEADARAAYPRCRTIEQRNIMTDGNSVWLPIALADRG